MYRWLAVVGIACLAVVWLLTGDKGTPSARVTRDAVAALAKPSGPDPRPVTAPAAPPKLQAPPPPSTLKRKGPAPLRARSRAPVRVKARRPVATVPSEGDTPPRSPEQVYQDSILDLSASQLNPLLVNCYESIVGWGGLKGNKGNIWVDFVVEGSEETGEASVASAEIDKRESDPHMLDTRLAECALESIYRLDLPVPPGGRQKMRAPITFFAPDREKFAKEYPELDRQQREAERQRGENPNDGSDVPGR